MFTTTWSDCLRNGRFSAKAKFFRTISAATNIHHTKIQVPNLFPNKSEFLQKITPSSENLPSSKNLLSFSSGSSPVLILDISHKIRQTTTDLKLLSCQPQASSLFIRLPETCCCFLFISFSAKLLLAQLLSQAFIFHSVLPPLPCSSNGVL